MRFPPTRPALGGSGVASARSIPMIPGLVLALACALGWGAFDAWRKRLASVVPAMPLVLLLALGHVPAFAAWMVLTGGTIRGAAYWGPGLASVVFNVLGNLAFLRSVRASPLSLTVPLLSFVPVFTALAAIPVLGEHPQPGQWLGVALVVVGALLLNADASAGRDPLALVRALVRERGSVPMLLTAASWTATLVLDKRALVHAHASAHGLVIMAGMSLSMAAILAARGQLGELRRLRGAAGTYGLALATGVAAMGLQLLAIPVVMLALLEAIKRALGLLSAVVLGRLMFDESITRAKVTAVLVMGGGASLVLLAG